MANELGFNDMKIIYLYFFLIKRLFLSFTRQANASETKNDHVILAGPKS